MVWISRGVRIKSEPDVCFVLKVLRSGERQTAVLLLGEEDGGKAGEGAGEAVLSAAQRGQGPGEGGELALFQVSTPVT